MLARGELTGTELPGFRATDRVLDQAVIDLDATLVTAHSDKQGAKGNFKDGFGYHPLGAWLDNTGEALAAVLRPGNAGSNTATDHPMVLDGALTQRWWPEIEAFLELGVTNARTEGHNRVIKQVKRVACGFRNQANYERRIMLHSAARRAA